MDYSLEATPRSELGKQVGRLRREGQVPGVIYGHKVKPLAVKVPERDFSKLYRRAGRSHLLQLKVSGERRTRPVLIKELQVNPRNSAAVHVDFFQVNLTEKITVQVPVTLTGESPAVKLNVGELLTLMHSLEISSLPNAIPGQIEIDISGLEEVDQAVRLADLTLPEGAEFAGSPDLDEVVVKIAQPRVQVEEEAPAAAAEGGAEAAEQPAQAAEESEPSA